MVLDCRELGLKFDSQPENIKAINLYVRDLKVDVALNWLIDGCVKTKTDINMHQEKSEF